LSNFITAIVYYTSTSEIRDKYASKHTYRFIVETYYAGKANEGFQAFSQEGA
jgi:hypothetical protein